MPDGTEETVVKINEIIEPQKKTPVVKSPKEQHKDEVKKTMSAIKKLSKDTD